MSALLEAEDLTLAYGERIVSADLDLTVEDGDLTILVGPNGCGKSTLLRALARLLKPRRGRVLMQGRDLADFRSRELARRIGLLPQSPLAPDGITAYDLVSRGRYPHQSLLRQWSAEDERAVAAAVAATAVGDLVERPVEELSGGQRQRVWLAMALAQETGILLLDEPTTFLDIAHQVEVLELCAGLVREHGRTLVVVLHDLNLAARYASRLVLMRDGAIQVTGPPREIIRPEAIEDCFGLRCRIIEDPATGTPLVLPSA